MRTIASCIWDAATDFEAKADDIRARVATMTDRYPLYD
ncbi:MAG: serine hydroxymethyltransferase, partial [Pseudoflavonifractor sp.]